MSNNHDKGGSDPRRILLTAGAACLSLALVFLLLSASAQAARLHSLLLSETLPHGGKPLNIAVNQTTHGFYVSSYTDTGTGGTNLYRFEEDGKLDTGRPELVGVPTVLQVAIDSSGGSTDGYAYVSGLTGVWPEVQYGLVQQFDAAGEATAVEITEAAIPADGTGQGGLPPVVNSGVFQPANIVVDGTGNVFVVERGARAIDEFNSSGDFVAQLAAGRIIPGGTTGIATDSSGHIFVTTANGGAVPLGNGLFELDVATGQCVPVGCTPIDPRPAFGVAVDSSDGKIFTTGAAGELSEGHQVEEGAFREYDAATGELLGVTRPAALRSPGGIAVDETSGKVFVTDNLVGGESTVKIFGPVQIVPDIETEAPEEITSASAKLKGEIGAAGVVGSTCVFQYVDQQEFEAVRFEGARTADCEPAGPFSGTAMNAVEATVEGLAGGTTYHERIVGTNENGSNSGEDIPFTTAGPGISGQEAFEVGETAATLRGVVDPRGLKGTSYVFQYITQSSVEASGWGAATDVPVGSGSVPLRANGRGDLEAGTSATGTGAVHAAIGIGDLHAGTSGVGSGNLSQESDEVTSLTIGKGTFEVGQPITGQGIPAGTTIADTGPGTLVLSAPAEGSATGVALTAGSRVVISLTTQEGTFEVGQPITGQGIPAGTTIADTGPGTLVLSAPAEDSATGVALNMRTSATGIGQLSAGSDEVTSLTTQEGTFLVGQPITGQGIPAGTTIADTGPGALVMSGPAEASGTGVALASGSRVVTSLTTGEGTFEVGQPIAGEGIPAGATIAAFGPGALVLSAPAKAGGSSASLASGSRVVTSLNTEEGSFKAGQTVAGPGIVAGTKVVRISAEGKAIVLSDGARQAVTGAPVTATEPLPVSQRINGLEPGTAYRFRILAESFGGDGAGASQGEDVPFVTYNMPVALPDERRYEQVSPIEKNGADAEGEFNAVHASPDGSRITFFSSAGIPGGEGEQDFPSYLATRASDSSGWSTQGLLPPASAGPRARILGWTEDLSDTYEFASPTFEPARLYARSSVNGSLAVVATIGAGNNPFRFAGASANGAVAIVESAGGGVLPGDLVGKQNVYVYSRETGTLSMAGIMNESVVPPGGAMTGPYPWFEGGTPHAQGGAWAGYYTQATHAISAAGDKVFFTAGDTGQLYVRLNPIAAQSVMRGAQCTEAATKACTIRISAPEEGVPEPGTPAAFLGASADGNLVYFLDQGKLTADATGGSGFDLYRYDLRSGELIDLTLDSTGTGGARVEGALAISESGEEAYFVAAGGLAGGAKSAPSGQTNLYAVHGITIHFLARLGTGGDEIRDWIPGANAGGRSTTTHDARVSADGQELLFTSSRQLTAYRNHGIAELYLYHVGEGIVCVSCNPSGEAPAGPAGLQRIPVRPLAPHLPFKFMTHNMSANGRRVFFDSADRLVYADHNSVNDVYEWEAPEEGSCTESSGAFSAQDEGCIYLLSGGAEGAVPSWFADADEKGRNAFFFTAQKLVAQDRDQLVDIYDARVEGGIPAQEQLPSPHCEGEAGCLGATPLPASPVAAGTSSYRGGGNPPAAKSCAKGKIKRRGRCVKKLSHRKHKHHKKKHRAKRSTATATRAHKSDKGDRR